MTSQLKLGVNIDHVATLRNARGVAHPDPVRAARLCAVAGGDQITVHLREDRRHIRDDDVRRLRAESVLPLNLELAATPDMLAIARDIAPAAACIVPERREEITTEGGLDVEAEQEALKPVIEGLKEAGITVSLFVDPDRRQLDMARALGADAVELHTGAYANAAGQGVAAELDRLNAAAAHGADIGLTMHAGHGLDYANVTPVASIAQIVELNIGHHLIGEAVFVGLEAAISRMRALMDAAHAPSARSD